MTKEIRNSIAAETSLKSLLYGFLNWFSGVTQQGVRKVSTAWSFDAISFLLNIYTRFKKNVSAFERLCAIEAPTTKL